MYKFYLSTKNKNLSTELIRSNSDKFINFKNIDDFTVEIDPRRVDEERLIFYNEIYTVVIIKHNFKF